MQFPPNAPMAAGFGIGGKPDFWIHIGPVHEGIPTAFRANKRSIVNAFYQAALAIGGRDNGAPGYALALSSALLRRLRARS